MFIRTTMFFTLLLCLGAIITAQQEWVPAAGSWEFSGENVLQNDASGKLSRVDIETNEDNFLNVSFTVQYVAGGYSNEQMFEKGEYHAGFGVHLGVEDPLLRTESWGNGDSYLLWINLDTREETRIDNPEHYGLRAQIYKSNSPSSMNLQRSPLIANSDALSSFSVEDYVSIDLVSTIESLSGVNASILDVISYFRPQGVEINMSADLTNGRISIVDPTNPELTFYVSLDPSVLSGNYVSLRTNSVALRFENISVN